MKDIDNEELDVLVSLIHRQYGYDFSDYAPSSLKRRFLRFMDHAAIEEVGELTSRLQQDAVFFERMTQFITVNVTEMFRDPLFYRALRELVLPRLATYPIIKIWHAGCATGEEVFSMIILLREAGLLERCRIYATDLNALNLDKAEKAFIPLKCMKDYTQNYQQMGGMEDFSGYYTADHEHAIIHPTLRRNVVFFQHNLVTDQVFNEFQLICCRNVFIYFNRQLQERVLRLFYDSLAPLGYLTLGLKESMLFSGEHRRFEPVSAAYKIFRRKN
ncbi:CheR family methyltransferase [Chitinophaga qingshengii]|uniref:Protein-glutamate O-methyltransferase CheR n=1 Tax=Chitinophaga qingshengii TaxID=1569794 RepID=A0ABR7TGT0_9BACT|nr:protein-glutamate O-methyltransferase CheR [Chitinophaga qingshengii]MBC9929692.1 protein-glutamate O-methyltransferase CheR [Chitinophaga qingshengii]